MGLFIKKRFPFLEADDDETTSDTSEAPVDNEGEGETTPQEDQSQEPQDTEEEQPAEEEIDGDEESEEDNNFDIDAEPEEEEESTEEEEPSDGEEDSTEDTSAEDESDMDTDSEEKQLDRAIFDTLSPEEQKQKIVTLKRLFLDLYNKCDIVINKFNSVTSKKEEISPITRRVILTLYDLKVYIGDYTVKLFDSKSYIENDVMFNRCLSVMNGIRIIAKDINKIIEDSEK